MSSISGLSSTTVSAYAATTATSQVSAASDPDGDGDNDAGRVERGHHRGGHGGGGLGKQLMDALKSLGFNLPAPPTQAANGSSAANGSQASSGSDSSSDSSSLRSDFRNFMHQLFDAVKQAESSSGAAASSSSGSSTGTGASGFAAGLSNLISEVSGGNAPAGLQSAFDKLATDLGGSSSSGATLQALLEKLQSGVGYAASSATASVGNLLSSSA